MRVINYVQGVCSLYFALDEVMTTGISPYTHFTETIQNRYGFQSVSVSAEAQQVGMLTPVFQTGQFTDKGVLDGIAVMEIKPDGLRVVCSTTDTAYAVAADLLQFAKQEFGIRSQMIRNPPKYASTLLVDLTDLEQEFFAFLKSGAQIIEDELRIQKKDVAVKPFGVRWITDDAHGNRTVCSFEKRVGPESGERVYVSQASLPTLSHERFLQRLLDPQ